MVDAHLQLPHFLCIGTLRAGTTWLHRALTTHPAVFLPSEKELMFFSHHYHRGLEWYARFFHAAPQRSKIGEVCPTYLASAPAAVRIRKHIPDAQLIVLLRDPTEQIWSRYLLISRRRHVTPDLSQFLEAKPSLLHDVSYSKLLSRFAWARKAGRLRVWLYEELTENPARFLQEVESWIGVPQRQGAENLVRRENATQSARLPTIEFAMSSIARTMRRRGLQGFKGLIARTGLVERIRRLNFIDAFEPPPHDLREKVTAALSCDICELENTLGRDLSSWKGR